MKNKLAALFAIAFMTASCVQENGSKEQMKQEYETLIIEGCEYLTFPQSYSHTMITHKGNCKNPIHNCK